MSNQAHGGESGLLHWTQISEETVFCNTNGKTSFMSFNPIVLRNNVPKLENVDFDKGHDQRFTTSTSGQSSLPSSAGDNVGLKSETSIQLNPVGSLQELCVARHFPFPNYTFSEENLKELDARFKVMCSISFYNSSGTGLTKQKAKKEAAYLMYKQVEKLTSEDLNKNIDNACEFKDAIYDNTFRLCHDSLTLLKIFFCSIVEPKTPHLQNIRNNSNELKLTAADTLKIISKRENYTVFRAMISQNCNKVEVLMQVNTSPVIVVSGSGKNESDAQESAARVILTYFKLKLNI